MQDNEQNITNEPPTNVTPPAAQPTPTTVPQTSNKKLYIILAAVFALMMVLIVLLAVLLLNKSDTSTSTNTSQDTSSNESTTNGQPSRTVALTVPTSDSKLQYVIYEPQQNGANTTIYFAVENICSGCSESTPTYIVTSEFSNKAKSFLVDDSNGKKYSLVTDEDGNELATPRCGSMLKFGDKSECFASFTKVPSGSTVSWVFGSNRIDNIKVE